ncbi:hypothetical protein HNV08_00005 [Winogradskyella eckloniae]|nr:hypothetical protein [Winogradskyella eckloniae]
MLTFQSYAQSKNLPLSGYYVIDSINHNLENTDMISDVNHSYSYLNMDEKTLTSYEFPKTKTGYLDIENKTLKNDSDALKAALIWKDKNHFAIHIQDTIFKPINIYAELKRVEKNDPIIVKINADIEQKHQQRQLKHTALKKQFLKPINTPLGYLHPIPETDFGLSKPLNVYQNTYIDQNFNYQLVYLEKDSLIEKNSIVFYGIYKHETNTNSFDGLNLAIIKSEKPFTLHSFIKKLNLKPLTIVFKTEETLLLKNNWGQYIFFTVKKLNKNSYAVAKGISTTFEYSKKQFQLFSSIEKAEDVKSLSIKKMFTEQPLTKVDSVFEKTTDLALKKQFEPYRYINATFVDEKLYAEQLTLQNAYLELKKESIATIIKSIKASHKAYTIIHQDENSFVFRNKKGHYNVFVLKSYNTYTVVFRLSQIKAFFSVNKPLQSAVYFYKNAKNVRLNAYSISENLTPYFNYFKSVWKVHNTKDNLFIVSNKEKKEAVLSITGNYVLPFIYDDINYSQESKGFYVETFKRQRVKSKPGDSIQFNYIKEINKKRGWVSEDGKQIIEPQYHGIGKINYTNFMHVYGFNDEEGILDISTKQYVIPFKKHDIRHYDQAKHFLISERYDIQYLANYKGDIKGPFEKLKYNHGEFIGIKNGNETKLLFD